MYTNEMYLGGMSSSMPEDVQYAMYRTVPGLENVRIVRNAYAIEYDCINAVQLKSSLEFKKIEGLFAGGQFMRKLLHRELSRVSMRHFSLRRKNHLYLTVQKVI